MGIVFFTYYAVDHQISRNVQYNIDKNLIQSISEITVRRESASEEGLTMISTSLLELPATA